MKCRYKYCKYGGEVEKSVAVKEGSSYFHEQCYKEKNIKLEIETFWNDNMPNAQPILIKKAINQLVHDKNYEADYVLYVIRYIKNHQRKINTPFGLLNYCDSLEMKNTYKKYKTIVEYDKIKNIEIDYEPEVIKFTYKKSDRKITDLI